MNQQLVNHHFGTTFRGQVLMPEDAAYDDARTIWNGMIDRRPAIIARCTGPDDVVEAVNFARDHGLPVSIKAGGHNVAGRAIVDDALVIDLSLMNRVVVDPVARRAYVEAGARLADLDHETQAYGLATTGGVHSGTGVSGLTLGGGMGYLARRFGLAIDNLLSVEVVTADGEIRRASNHENADLFWALRGGGGGMAVVTSFEFQLHEVGPDVLVAQSYIPFSEAAAALRFYREFTATAPRELACYGFILRIPPVAPFPDESFGELAVALVACYSDDIETGETYMAPLLEFGDPILKFAQPMPYIALQQSFDTGSPDGARYFYKSRYLNEITDEAIDTIVDNVGTLPGPLTLIGFEPLGGAISDIGETDTAFANRDAVYNFSVWSGWFDALDDEAIIAWTRQFHEAMQPHASGGTYVNYLDRDDDARLTEAFGMNHKRLVELQHSWDPDDVFRKAGRQVGGPGRFAS